MCRRGTRPSRRRLHRRIASRPRPICGPARSRSTCTTLTKRRFETPPSNLSILKEDVGQGNSHTERNGTTDDNGVLVFEGLPIGTAYTYRASVARGAGTFSSDTLRLNETSGQRMLLHVFDVTTDLREALVGLRGVVFIQPREDIFHLEASFQVINIGTKAWVPDHVTYPLPDGAKAFRSSDATADTRIDKADGGGLELRGTYSPGQREVGYQFEVSNDHLSSHTFHIPLPPHVAELRVVAEGARSLVLTAAGFPGAEPMMGQDGSRLLVTDRHLTRGDPALDFVDITLDNLPIPSDGRWYAVGIALCFAFAGLFEATRPETGKKRTGVDAEENREAEELVLDELVLLEKLKRSESIGPRAYQDAHAELIAALARLEARRNTA